MVCIKEIMHLGWILQCSMLHCPCNEHCYFHC